MTDERRESLAAQAASWVPPWERAPREPDRAYQAAADDPDISADIDEPAQESSAGASAPTAALDEPDSVGQPDEGDKVDEAGLSDDDDDFDESFEGPNPARYSESENGEDVPPELAPLPGEATGEATVDAPQELPGEESREPTDVSGGSELPLPAAIEEASEEHADAGSPVDAPIPEDGDAGDVFDQAADDDVNDDEVDFPIAEEVPEAADPDVSSVEDVPDDDEPAVEDAPAEDGDGWGEPAVEDVDERDDDGPEVPLLRGGDGSGALFAGPESGAETTSVDRGSVAGGGIVGDGSVAGGGIVGDGSVAGGGIVGDGSVAVPGGADGSSAAGDAQRGRRARAGSGIPAQGRGSAAPGAAVEEPGERTEENELDLPPMDDGELRAALEAILLVVDEPVGEMQLAQIMEQPTERIARVLDDISARYTAAGHGFDLRRAAGGWRLYTRPEYAPYVERFVLDGQSVRLTQAALETLAVVAYKQPVTRSRISAIRGVNCDGVMRTLVTRGLIEECGTESETGAFLYRTTALFLEKLGLNSVDQLPPLAPFLPDDVEEVLDASG